MWEKLGEYLYAPHPDVPALCSICLISYSFFTGIHIIHIFPNSVPPKNKDTLLHRVQSFLKETLQTFISLQLTVGISVISWPHIFLYKSIPFFSLIQYSVSDDVLILFNLFWPRFLRCNWHHYHKVSYTSISLLFCGFWWFISFHLWIIFYCLDVPQFVYSFINWSYLDCFQVLTAVNKAAIDFCM